MYAVVIIAWATLGSGPDANGTDWRYLMPPAGDRFEHGPMRMIGLSRRPPEDVKERVDYRGVRRRYGQLRFGDPGSTRVALVLDEGDDGIDLYVDADRDRRIDATDRVAGDGGVWPVSIPVEHLDGGQPDWSAPRTVVFRRGRVGGTLSHATAGCLEGRARLGGRERAVRRVDADGNGLWTDPTDLLWIDLNSDGAWDPIIEQFAYSPILRVGDERFVVRSDSRGERLSFEPLTGTGRVRLAVKPRSDKTSVLAAIVGLAGRDGSAFVIDGVERPRELPVGEYRITSVALHLADPAGGRPWGYSFSCDSDSPSGWRRLDRDGELVLEPFAKFDVDAGLPGDTSVFAPGEVLTIRPRVHAADRLLINSCFRGATETYGASDAPAGRIALVGRSGPPAATALSGFA